MQWPYTDLSIKWSCYFILITFIILLISPFLPETVYYEWLLSETGFIECATVFSLIIGIIFAFRILRLNKSLPPLIKPVTILFIMAAIFFAGEELDWGQVWFEIETPQKIVDINREGQFSLHKIDGHPIPRFLFNVGPRLLATLVMILGALWPFIAEKSKDRIWMRKFVITPLFPLLPTFAVTPIFAFAAFSTLPAKIVKSLTFESAAFANYLELAFRKPSGELKEYAIAAAMLFYILSLYVRVKALCQHKESIPPLTVVNHSPKDCSPTKPESLC